MKKQRSFLSGLLALIMMLSLFSSGYTASESRVDAAAGVTSVPIVSLRAASGAGIMFEAQDGPVVKGASRPGGKVPHLVLRRNGALTDPEERTLIVEVTGVRVSAPGVTITLSIETQHADPDPPQGAASGGAKAALPSDIVRGSERRIPVWREARWVANRRGSIQTGVTTVFTHTFHETVISGTEAIATPTDYFRYDVSVINASQPITSPLDRSGESGPASLSMSGDHAFLMENQWIARLPEVPEESPGAAPDELIVYYCDMFPFQKDARDPATWLAREDVPDYVRTDLVPQMVEAFRVQSDDWGFPWYKAWTSYRRGEDAGRLSVALSDGRTWFHGRAPLRGHSGISMRVSGGDNADYDTLTDGLMSSFHHELFHNLQRNINQHGGGDGIIGGAERAWQFFSEGTAVVASSVGQPDLQLTSLSRSYLQHANGFMGSGGLRTDLSRSYARMSPYHAAIYWRFLYEQCGLTEEGSLEPEAGMQVIRRALTILYSGEVVDISASTDLVGALPEIMDRALSSSPCLFDTHAESLAAFTRALYALRLEDGRCTAPGTPAGCGLYDPHNLYFAPILSTLTYSGADAQHAGEIPTSFGADFVDVILDRAADGRPLTLEFQAAKGATAEFTVQVWELKDWGDGPLSRPVLTQEGGPTRLKATTRDGKLLYVVPVIDTAKYNRLSLIITRVDAKERSDPVGEYTIFMR